MRQLAPREQWAATSPTPDFSPAEGGLHLVTGGRVSSRGKRQVLRPDPRQGTRRERLDRSQALLLSRGFVSPGSSVKKHPGSSHPLALPQIHAVRRGSVPRYQEGNGGQREEVEVFEEKGNVSLLTVWECLCFGRCQENAAAKQERIYSKSFQNIGAGVKAVISRGLSDPRPVSRHVSINNYSKKIHQVAHCVGHCSKCFVFIIYNPAIEAPLQRTVVSI